MVLPARILIVDACVLIDFLSADPALLALVARHVGEVQIALPVLEEVRQLDPDRAASLGIKVYEPSLAVVMDAAGKRGRLSFQDRVCLAIARAEGWTCVSNDRQLRAACTAESVPVLWGLQLVGMLVVAGALTVAAARGIAEAIVQANPRIGQDVLARFLATLEED